MSFNAHRLEQTLSPLSMSPLKALLIAVRPPTLLVGLGPVLIGLSLGIAKWHELAVTPARGIWSGIAAVFLVLLLQAAANLVNDAKDAAKGVDNEKRLGPLRVVQSGLLSMELVRMSYRLCFSLAALIVFALYWSQQDLLIPAVAAGCALAAYAYTAGPFPLAYFALGELVACIFFGPVAVMGTFYLLTGQLLWETAAWGLGSGFIAAAIMAINNFRDRASDQLAGKRTIANLLGGESGRNLPLLLVLCSLGVLLNYGIQHNKIIIAVPWTLLGLMFIRRRIIPRLVGEGPLLNQALKFTALFNFFYALLFASLVLL